MAAELGASFLCCYVQSFRIEDRDRVSYICHKDFERDPGHTMTLKCFGEWISSGRAVLSVSPSADDDDFNDKQQILSQLSPQFTVKQLEPCMVLYKDQYLFRLVFMKRIRHKHTWNLVTDIGKFHCNSFRFLRLFHFKFRVPKKIGIHRNITQKEHASSSPFEQFETQDDHVSVPKRHKGGDPCSFVSGRP